MTSKYVDGETAWVAEHHTLFLGYHFRDKIGLDKDARDQWSEHPYFDAAATFCADWGQVAFDDRNDTLPSSSSFPAMEEVLSLQVSNFA